MDRLECKHTRKIIIYSYRYRVEWIFKKIIIIQNVVRSIGLGTWVRSYNIIIITIISVLVVLYWYRYTTGFDFDNHRRELSACPGTLVRRRLLH